MRNAVNRPSDEPNDGRMSDFRFDYGAVHPAAAKFPKGQADRIRRQCVTSVIQIGNALIMSSDAVRSNPRLAENLEPAFWDSGPSIVVLGDAHLQSANARCNGNVELSSKRQQSDRSE